MKYVLIISVLIVVLFIYMIAPSVRSKKYYSWFFKNEFAHRGLFDKKKGIPENSIAAFRRAIHQHIGIELDLCLTADEQIVVFHDTNLRRMTGFDAHINATNYQELKNLRLNNTDEPIPLFSQALKCVDGRVPLIIELKTCANYRVLCKKTVAVLHTYGGNFCIESFDPRIVRWLKKHAPNIVRGQLSKKHIGNNIFLNAASYLLTNFIGRPNFIAYKYEDRNIFTLKLCRLMGAGVALWTITKDYENAKRAADTIIFERPSE